VTRKSKRDFVKEILDKESPFFPPGPRWERTNSFLTHIHDLVDFVDKIDDLEQIFNAFFESATEEDEEGLDLMYSIEELEDVDFASLKSVLMRYIPIALVAITEHYFKSVISNLVDYDVRFRRNLSNISTPLSFDLIVNLEQSQISLSYFVAHILPTNSLEKINRSVSTILGEDFLKLLKNKYPKAAKGYQLSLFDLLLSEDELAQKIQEELQNRLNTMLSVTQLIFELRNKYAHEPIFPKANDERTIIQGASAITEFLWASEQVFRDILST